MGFYLGNTTIQNAYLGSSLIQGLYLGNTQFWPSGSAPTQSYDFNFGDGFSGIRYDVFKYNNQFYIGGIAGTYSSSINAAVLSIDNNGTSIQNYPLGTALGFTDTIWVTPDGKVMMTGDFTLYSGSTVNDAVRANSDSTLDTTWVKNGSYNNIRDVYYDSVNNRYWFGCVSYLTVTNDSGSIVNESVYGNRNANSLLPHINGTQIVTPKYDGTNYDLEVWNKEPVTLSTTLPTNLNNIIQHLAQFTDGDYLAVGQFSGGVRKISQTGGVTGSYNGSTGYGPSAMGTGRVGRILSDGSVIIGGSFNTISYNGVAYQIRGIFKIKPNGDLDTTWFGGTFGTSDIRGVNTSEAVYDIQILDDDSMLVIGSFTKWNDINGAYDTATNIAHIAADGTFLS